MAIRRSIGGFRRNPPQRRRLARLAGRLSSLLLGVLVAGLAGVVLRLERGPIVLEGVAPRVAALAVAALNEGGGPALTVALGEARLELGHGPMPTPGLSFTDLRVAGAGGETIIAAPLVRIGFRPLDLLAGQLRLTGITVEGAALRLERESDSRLVGDLAPFSGGAQTRSQPTLPALVDSLLHDPPPLLETLRSIRLEGLDLAVQDWRSGALLSFHGTSARLVRDGEGLNATIRVPTGGGAGSVVLEARYGADRRLRIDAAANGLSLDDLAGIDPALAPLAGLPLAVEALGRITLSPDGALEAARGELALEPGTLRPGSGAAPVAFDGASIAAALDASSGMIVVDRLTAGAMGAAVEARGTVEPLRDAATGAINGAVVTLALGGVVLPLGDPMARPRPATVRFDGGTLVARVRPGPWRVEIAEAHLPRGAASLGLSGALTEARGVWTADLHGRIRELTVSDLVALWPARVAPGAKLWVREHMLGGVITEGEAFLRGPLADPAAQLDFAFRDASAAVLPPLPPIMGGRGWGSVGADGFALTLESGEVQVPGPTGGMIALDGSSFRLDDLEDETVPSEIAVLGQGAIPAILTLIASEPLSLLDRVAIAPGDVTGSAAVTARLRVPLLRDLRLEQVGVTAEAALSDVTVAGSLLPSPLAAPALRLTADTARLRVEGSGQIGDMALDLVWDETFSPGGDEPRTTVALSGRLDAAALGSLGAARALGLRATQPVPVEARLVREGPGLEPGQTGFEATADLRGLAAAVPALGWRKAAGAAGRLLAAGVLGGSVRLDRLELDSAGLSLRGRGGFDAAGGLRELTLDRLRIGAGTDLSARVARRDGTLVVSARGARLDARPLLDAEGDEAGRDEAGARGGTPLRLDLAVDRLLLRDDVSLDGAAARVARDAGGGLSVRLTGAVQGGAAAQLALDHPAGQDGRLRVTSDDAGGLLRGAGLFARALGGRLDLEATLRGDGAADGEARIAGVVVSDDPRLDELLAGADLKAALETLRQEGIRFDTVRAPFRLRAGRLTLLDAVAHGPVIGLTVSGDYDIERDALAMEGVFTPLYGVNGLLGNVPVIGTLLTGGEGQGLIAFTFDLTGPASDPQTTVNPLSMLLPGVLRELIRPRAAPG